MSVITFLLNLIKSPILFVHKEIAISSSISGNIGEVNLRGPGNQEPKLLKRDS